MTDHLDPVTKNPLPKCPECDSRMEVNRHIYQCGRVSHHMTTRFVSIPRVPTLEQTIRDRDATIAQLRNDIPLATRGLVELNEKMTAELVTLRERVAELEECRRLLHDIETDADPSGTIREAFALRENQVALVAERDAANAKLAPQPCGHPAACVVSSEGTSHCGWCADRDDTRLLEEEYSELEQRVERAEAERQADHVSLAAMILWIRRAHHLDRCKHRHHNRDSDCDCGRELLLNTTAAAPILARLEAADKLEAFKTFVHTRLDEMGVPESPDPERTANTGCRIGPRLDFLLQRAERAEAACAAYRGFIVNQMQWCGFREDMTVGGDAEAGQNCQKLQDWLAENGADRIGADILTRLEAADALHKAVASHTAISDTRHPNHSLELVAEAKAEMLRRADDYAATKDTQ